jgi:DNA-binding CsgD family transcriptional regulator
MVNRLQRRLDRAVALLDAMAVCETPDDFAMVLVNTVFKQEHLGFAYVFDNDGTTELRRLGGFGDAATSQLAERVSIWENIGVAQSYRENAIVRIEDAQTYQENYNIAFLSSSGQGVICSPINIFGKTTGGFSLVFRDALSLHEIDDAEIHLVQLCAAHLLRDWRARSLVDPPVNLYTPSLTARQLTIVKELREGVSLREIGVMLSVSHATVKSEVQKVYRALGVHKKRDAISVGDRIGLFSESPTVER